MTAVSVSPESSNENADVLRLSPRRSSRIRASGPKSTPRAERETSCCHGTATKYRCVEEECGHEVWKWHGCGKSTCEQPGCRKATTKRRAKRLFERLGLLEEAPWGIVVLTLPEELWTAARRPSVFRKLARAAVDTARTWFTRWHFGGSSVQLGGALTAHPCRQNEEVWSPHFNVLVPLIGLLDDGAARRGRYKVPPEALDHLRELWTDVLREHGWEPRWQPQVFYEFRLEVERKLHSARYFGRSFPMWSNWTQRISYWGILRRGTSPLEGAEPVRWPKPDALCLCVKCGAPTMPTEKVTAGRWEVFDGEHWRPRDGPPDDPRVAMAWNPEGRTRHGAGGNLTGETRAEHGRTEVGRQVGIDACLGVLGRES